MDTRPVEIFCCYAREDQDLLIQLKKHLMPLQKQGPIRIWSDTDLNAGVEWEKELRQHLEIADIILLLISSDFMNSDYCYSTEMGRAIERHGQGSAHVIPILLRPTLWRDAPFSRLQIAPINTKPVTRWQSDDDAFHNIAEHLSQIIPEIQLRHTLREANKHRNMEHHEEALVCYEQVLSLDPTNGSALFGKALSLYYMGQTDASIEAFLLAEQTTPTAGDSLSYYLQAHALQKRERYTESLAAYEQAIRLSNNDPSLYISKANMLYHLKRYEEALAAYQQAFHLSSSDPSLYISKADTLYHLKRYEEALVGYEYVIRLDSQNIDVHRKKGKCLLRLQHYEEALITYQRALYLEANNPFIYKEMGDVLLYLERYEEALSAYEQAITLRPDFGAAYFAKGLACERFAPKVYEKFQQLAQSSHEKARQLGVE